MEVAVGPSAARRLAAHGLSIDALGWRTRVDAPVRVVTPAEAAGIGEESASALLIVLAPGEPLPRSRGDLPIELLFLPASLEELRRRAEWLAHRVERSAVLDPHARERLILVGRVAAGISHELRNCLGYVRTSVEFAATRLARSRSSRPELEQAIADALEGLQHATGVTTTVLDLVRGARPALAPVDVNELVARTLRVARPALPRGVRIERRCEPCPPAAASIGAMVQVLTNLVLNAAQAAAPRGLVRVGERVEGEEVVLSVADSGPGVPRDRLEPLFTPLSSNKPETGTGIGLSLSRELVDACGGRLTVGLGPLGGAEFSVFLKIAESASEVLIS